MSAYQVGVLLPWHTIYVVKHPVTLLIVYVGRTKQDIEDRLNGHLSKARLGQMDNLHFSRWLLELESQGLRPLIEPCGFTRGLEMARLAETKFIREYRAANPGLFNVQKNPENHQLRPFSQRYLRRVGAL